MKFGIGFLKIDLQNLNLMQSKLFKSARAALTLDEKKMFNKVLADKGLQGFILFLNKSQLFDGEDSLGVSLKQIGGGYSFTTEVLTAGKSFTFAGESKTKKQGESPFLYDSGEYYDSFNLKLGDGFFKIDSNPEKEFSNLEESYGDNLEGLQDENLQKIIDVIRKKFIQLVRESIQA
jgi:hypothetical protein